MADKQFDRVVFNPRERPLSTDHNQMQSQLIRTINGTGSLLLSDRSSIGMELPAFRTAFMGVSFFPYALGGMTITLAGGTGRMYDPTLTASTIGGIGGINDADDIYPLYLSSSQTLSVPAADATNPRIDIIEVKVDRRLETPLTRDV